MSETLLPEAEELVRSRHDPSKRHRFPRDVILLAVRWFRTLARTRAARAGIETFRSIRIGQFESCETGEINEIGFPAQLFQDAA